MRQWALWQQVAKRLTDVTISAVGLVLLSPLMLFVAYKVWRSSPGPVLYVQERLGYRRRPFCIIKFRSMHQAAEPLGPVLSFKGDPRITPWGRTMRQWRLDELPQLWNVLRGDMSLVGPRAERAFYVAQIIPQFPQFNTFFSVKPGLTSLGMVMFGYAQNRDQMVRRARYDWLYLQKKSLLLDAKIMLLTLRIILRGKWR